MKTLNDYTGITHIPIRFDFLYKLWKRFLCKRNIHCFDECVSGADLPYTWNHYLVCDACQLTVYIEKIDTTYCKKD